MIVVLSAVGCTDGPGAAERASDAERYVIDGAELESVAFAPRVLNPFGAQRGVTLGTVDDAQPAAIVLDDVWSLGDAAEPDLVIDGHDVFVGESAGFGRAHTFVNWAAVSVVLFDVDAAIAEAMAADLVVAGDADAVVGVLRERYGWDVRYDGPPAFWVVDAVWSEGSHVLAGPRLGPDALQAAFFGHLPPATDGWSQLPVGLGVDFPSASIADGIVTSAPVGEVTGSDERWLQALTEIVGRGGGVSLARVNESAFSGPYPDCRAMDDCLPAEGAIESVVVRTEGTGARIEIRLVEPWAGEGQLLVHIGDDVQVLFMVQVGSATATSASTLLPAEAELMADAIGP